MKIFISHSSDDKWVAKRIACDLEALEVEVFLDSKNIAAGDSIPSLITQNLKNSDEILILLTPASIHSQWVLVELGGAIALEKHIIPILHHVAPEAIPKSISNLLARDLNEIEECYLEIQKRDIQKRLLRPQEAMSEDSTPFASPSDSNRVFLIHGYDKRSPDASKAVSGFLKSCGVEVEMAGSYPDLDKEIESGLLERMRHCMAIVVLCTPDVKYGDGTFRPSQNVSLEVGVALGLQGGVQKLIVLQRWGSDVIDQAQLTELPFAGLSPIMFNEIDSVFEELKSRLSALGVTLVTHK